jgi:hypothetical protein
MSVKKYNDNRQANESVSKFKLISAYGGPGSIMHTEYGSIMVSCIEEWGFIKKIEGFIEESSDHPEIPEEEYIKRKSDRAGLEISSDQRLLKELKEIKKIGRLRYLALVPDLNLDPIFNNMKSEKTEEAISSVFFPKGFLDFQNNYNPYHVWYSKWLSDGNSSGTKSDFFPPKTRLGNNVSLLKQDNVSLICKHGHISDFPWSKFLRWRAENKNNRAVNVEIDLFNTPNCCGTEANDTSEIRITSNSANSSGFDGKRLKCENCGAQASLEGLMSVKIKCPGHKPWEVGTGSSKDYFGNTQVRRQLPKSEKCDCNSAMRVALTTGNNLYYSSILSSIFLPNQLFQSPLELEISSLITEKDKAVKEERYSDAQEINNRIKELGVQAVADDKVIISPFEKEERYRYQEFNVLLNYEKEQINVDKDFLVDVVTDNLKSDIRKYFKRIVRVDNMKITSAQLGFSRVNPVDADANDVKPQNIFRNSPENVLVYPVVENFGEGIFFGLDYDVIEKHLPQLQKYQRMLQKPQIPFASGAVNTAKRGYWQLYLVHTLSHLLMRELEFTCGYPTASLSERIYVSNSPETKMYGFLIYTSGGAEGSMGGLIAQTRESNLNRLIKSALKRATICNSDPLCWESDGQGLFELNLASCFSCGLVSETSCEHRNLFLDRRILVDDEFGLFKDIVK